MMESPVRICIGAALVVNLLLLCSAPAHGFALPAEVSTTPKDDSSKYNFTRTIKPRKAPEIKTPDVSLNELSPKGSTSEEHTEKNAKYKDRGRVRFGAQRRSTTETPVEKSSSETLSLIIVTPTPEVKKPAQIIDSMRSYKKTKLPTLISSTTPISKRSTSQSSEEFEDKSGEESEESYEKFTSRNFHNSYFTAPNFEAFDFSQDTENQDRNKYDYNTSPYSFSAGFPQDSFTYKDDKDPFKSSFFDFETELTTPKNDFFDSRYKKVSSSIINRIQAMKAKAAQRNATNQNSTNENVDLGKLSNNTPSHNISSVFIKNTKEIRLKDNEGAGSANKELSDVQGTSVYYEMSVLSTETYTINHSNEDDCDTEPTSDPAVSSSSETTGSLKATQPTIEATTKPSLPDEFDEIIASPTFFPFSTANPILNVVPLSTQNSLSSITERQSRISGFRNRSYSKRLNTNGVKDSLNNVTPKTEVSTARTRKFHQTTRIKPVWMSPRNNVTRIRSSTPKTIYSEHFDIKDRFSTPKSKPTRTVLTTVSSSEIDPILQTEVSGVKKVVHSQTVKQNSIPTLRKRGSMKYGTSTASSAELEAELSELEMPSTAWALAKLISPPPLPSPAANEVQKVAEEKDKKETTMASTSTTTPVPISNEIITKKDTEYDQNKPQMQPVYVPTSAILDRQVEAKTEKTVKANITKESNLASQPPVTVTTESPKDNIIDAQVTKEVKPLWIPNAIENETTSAKSVLDKTIPPIDATRSTGFESITKLPADVTTPQDEVVASSELNQTVAEETPITTTDYEITTIRFFYVPTDQTEDSFDDAETTTQTVQKAPTRTKLTSETDEPITTYRPRYITTETIESTTILPDTTPVLEVSSQVEDETTELDTPTVTEAITTEDLPTTTEKVAAETMTTETATTTEESTKGIDLVTTKQPVLTTVITTTESATTQHEETTTTANKEYSTIIEVRTEINTEISTSFKQEPTTDTSQSEENSNSNEIIYEPKTESTTMTPEVSSPKNVLITSSVIELDTTVPDTATVTETSKIIESTTDDGDKGLEDDKYGDMTTEASSRVLPEEAGSGAAIAIVVSTIGVIALILLIGLLVVVRRRGRRGVYAQRCTPVSLDAYSLDSVSVGHRKGNQRLRASKRSYGNPAYDDEVTSHPMQYSALANFALDIDSITTEFSEIPTVTVRPEEVPPGCEDKNRYSNVLPLPETRVPLKRIGNDPTSEYINANYVIGPGNIKNYYILCQAPLSNTVSDFWRMIWEQNSRLVVMLTEYMENEVEKCYEYLPPSEISDNKRIFGDFKVILKKREQRDKYAISSVQLINMATRTWREVTHLWYFWPAKGVPEDYDSVIDFLFEMRSYMKVAQTAKEYDEEGVEVIYGDRSSFNNLTKLKSDENGSGNGLNVYSPAKAEEQMRRSTNNNTLSRMKAASEVEGIRPCVVVCASGAGRAGALAALDVCARALAAGAVDVPRAVRALRTQRPHSLSNRQHYIFLYKVLSEYGNKIMGNGDTI